jgi:hypothetical protein
MRGKLLEGDNLARFPMGGAPNFTRAAFADGVQLLVIGRLDDPAGKLLTDLGNFSLRIHLERAELFVNELHFRVQKVQDPNRDWPWANRPGTDASKTRRGISCLELWRTVLLSIALGAFSF